MTRACPIRPKRGDNPLLNPLLKKWRCHRCRKSKMGYEFATDLTRKTGLSGFCIPCKKARRLLNIANSKKRNAPFYKALQDAMKQRRAIVRRANGEVPTTRKEPFTVTIPWINADGV